MIFKKPRLKIAFIGAGYMASEHLKAFSTFDNIEITGIFSRTKERASSLSKKYKGLKAFDSIKELYTSTNADLVVIAVPELACFSICAEAFKYSWTLLIEKPVGHTFSEAREIEKLANKYNSKVYVAFNRRFYDSTLQLKRHLESTNGKRLVTIQDQEDPGAALAAGQPKKVVDNWMFANSIHLIDYFSQFCRGQHICTNVIQRWEPSHPAPVLAELEFSSGDIGFYQALWNAPGPWSVAVSTAELRAELRPIEQLHLQFSGSRNITSANIANLDEEYKPGLWKQAEQAINATLGINNELPTLEDANKSMSLVNSIYFP